MKENLEIIILGCGSSGGVPRVSSDWGACDPNEPKNRRTRCSIALQYWQGENHVPFEERTTVLIDTSPDLREQLLQNKINRLDAVLYTHDHADQVHGIDDLRPIAYIGGKRLPVYLDAQTKRSLSTRFGYCFEQPEGRVHPPILEIQDTIKAGNIIKIDGPGGELKLKAIEVSHGNYNVLGFTIFDKIAYTPDVHDIAPEVLKALNGLEIWILDALRYHNHPTHAHADKTLSWAAQTCTKRLVMTNLHIDMDYNTLRRELPSRAYDLAHDGMTITFTRENEGKPLK